MEAITILGNNSYYYNFNIHTDENGEEKFDYVKLTGTPNFKDCFNAVVRYYYSLEDELSMLHDFNYAEYFFHEVSEYENSKNYIDFLRKRDDIREMVKKDFE